MPDVIGDGGADAVNLADGGAVEDEGEASNQARIDELVSLGYVDEETTAELFDDLFDLAADKFGSDHWKLKPRNRERLARPGCACLNSVIQSVFDALPDAVGASASAHPEWAALALALGSVAGPRAIKQLKVRKAQKTAGSGSGAAGLEKKPAAAAPAPAKSSGPLGIPVASGTLQ